jgi:hypothetical protein
VFFRITALLAALSVFAPASATTFCVATPEDLTAALLAAENDGASAEIRLRTGAYPAPAAGWHVDIQHKGIAIIGGFLDGACETLALDAALTVLDGHAEVRPLTIDTSFHDVDQKGGQILITGLTIQNGSGDRVGGLKVSDAGPIYNGAILIERNIFRNNVAADYQQDNSSGALLAATDGDGSAGLTFLIVRNNLFAGNRARDAAAAMLFSNNAIAVNGNTFSGNQATDMTLPVRTAVASFTFAGIHYTNNILWDNNPDGLDGSYDLRADSAISAALVHASLVNNDVQSISGTPALDQDNQAVDPGFVDAAGGNFRLAATSLLIDAGIDVPAQGGIGAVDLDGRMRQNGLHVDLGAYEFVPDLVFADGFEAD